MDLEDVQENREKYFLTAISLLVLVVAVAVFTGESTPINDDSISRESLQIRGISYEPYDAGEAAIDLGESSEELFIYGKLRYSAEEDVSVKFYSKDGDAISDYSKNVDQGEGTISLTDFPIDGLSRPTEFSACFTKDPEMDWSRSSEGVVCKDVSFKPPNLDLQITPETLSFSISPDSDAVSSCKERTISVKNTGDISVLVTPALKNNESAGGSSEPYVQVDETPISETLVPSETTEFKYSVCADESDSDIQTVGYIVVGSEYYNARSPSITEFPFAVNVEVKKGA